MPVIHETPRVPVFIAKYKEGMNLENHSWAKLKYGDRLKFTVVSVTTENM